MYLDHPRSVFVGLCHCVKFDWNPCSSFHDMLVLMFCEFGSHPILGGFARFDPLDGIQYQPISQNLNIRVIAVLVVY